MSKAIYLGETYYPSVTKAEQALGLHKDTLNNRIRYLTRQGRLLTYNGQKIRFVKDVKEGLQKAKKNIDKPTVVFDDSSPYVERPPLIRKPC